MGEDGEMASATADSATSLEAVKGPSWVAVGDVGVDVREDEGEGSAAEEGGVRGGDVGVSVDGVLGDGFLVPHMFHQLKLRACIRERKARCEIVTLDFPTIRASRIDDCTGCGNPLVQNMLQAAGI